MFLDICISSYFAHVHFEEVCLKCLLMSLQYPVISVDNELPVVNPFCGKEYGKLKVLLAMGSMEQVSHTCSAANLYVTRALHLF